MLRRGAGLFCRREDDVDLLESVIELTLKVGLRSGEVHWEDIPDDWAALDESVASTTGLVGWQGVDSRRGNSGLAGRCGFTVGCFTSTKSSSLN